MAIIDVIVVKHGKVVIAGQTPIKSARNARKMSILTNKRN
jgi:hypothetical protein